MSDDAARVNWGSPWRMPTEEEWRELKKKCKWTWITLNGVKGYKVVSKKNGNSIFLPVAGSRCDGSLNFAGKNGHYCSSTLYVACSYDARELFLSQKQVRWVNYSRFKGLSVRPVVE